MNWKVMVLDPAFEKQYRSGKCVPLTAWKDSGLNICTDGYVKSQQIAERKFPKRSVNVIHDDKHSETKKEEATHEVTNTGRHGDNRKSRVLPICSCGPKKGDNSECQLHGWG